MIVFSVSTHCNEKCNGLLVFLEGELWCARGLISYGGLSKCRGVLCVCQSNRSSRVSFSKYKALGLGRGITKGNLLKLQLHDAIYRLRFDSNSLIHILSLANSHSNVASIQKNRGDKSHRVIVALLHKFLEV